MRKFLAGRLIRLAHLTYRPQVTEIHYNAVDPEAAAAAIRRVMARRESRGWNN